MVLDSRYHWRSIQSTRPFKLLRLENNSLPNVKHNKCLRIYCLPKLYYGATCSRHQATSRSYNKICFHWKRMVILLTELFSHKLNFLAKYGKYLRSMDTEMYIVIRKNTSVRMQFILSHAMSNTRMGHEAISFEKFVLHSIY